MKLYVYYRIGDRANPYANPIPYAHTTSKKLADAFEYYRDMNYFVRKVDHIKGRSDIPMTYRNNEIKMGLFETKSHSPITAEIKRKVDVEIPCTWGEESQVFMKMDQVFFELGKSLLSVYDGYTLMKKSYKKLLKPFYIDLIYRFYTQRFLYGDMEVYMGKTPDEQLFAGYDDLWMLDRNNKDMMRVDQFGLFLVFFGDTLNPNISYKDIIN